MDVHVYLGGRVLKYNMSVCTYACVLDCLHVYPHKVVWTYPCLVHLFQAILGTCFIPVYSGYCPPVFRGKVSNFQYTVKPR